MESGKVNRLFSRFEKTMDTLTNLRTFILVANTSNITQAAQHLGVSPSVVSKRLSQLEHQLRGSLFDRTTHYVRLTEFGQQSINIARGILHRYEDLLSKRGDHDKLTGTLRIKVPAILLLNGFGQVFWKFRKRHPDVDLQVIMLDRPIDPERDGFDIVISIGPAPNDAMYQEKLFNYERIFVASPEYLAERGTPQTPYDLEQHDCLFVEREGGIWSFASRQQPRVSLGSGVSSSSALPLIEAAIAGLGVALLWRPICIDQIANGQLVNVLSEYPTVDRWVTVATIQERDKVPRVAAMIEALRAAVPLLANAACAAELDQ